VSGVGMCTQVVVRESNVCQVFLVLSLLNLDSFAVCMTRVFGI
jgi:hypothetical protein